MELCNSLFCNDLLAGPEGLEPPTYCLEGSLFEFAISIQDSTYLYNTTNYVIILYHSLSLFISLFQNYLYHSLYRSCLFPVLNRRLKSGIFYKGHCVCQAEQAKNTLLSTGELSVHDDARASSKTSSQRRNNFKSYRGINKDGAEMDRNELDSWAGDEIAVGGLRVRIPRDL